MRVTGIYISRPIWDGLLYHQAKEFGLSDHEAEKAVEAEYPKSTEECRNELLARGLAPSEWYVHQYAREHCEKRGRRFLWSKKNVDGLGRQALNKGQYTIASQIAASLQLTVHDFARAIRENKNVKEIAAEKKKTGTSQCVESQ